MARYIDADMAISAIDRAVCDYCACPCDKPYSKKCNAIDNYSAGIRVIEPIIHTFIEDLPSADVRENVKGEWIWNPDGMDWGIGAWVCSKCGNKPETWWENDKSISPLRCSGSSFCPNCGADMRGERKC